jgi:hypothetical protein
MSRQINSEQSHSEGVVAMLVQHFEGHQLTRLLDLRASVASGECLGDSSNHFLIAACREAMQSIHYVRRHPEYQDLYMKSVGLYKEIAQRGLENERSGISA